MRLFTCTISSSRTISGLSTSASASPPRRARRSSSSRRIPSSRSFTRSARRHCILRVNARDRPAPPSARCAARSPAARTAISRNPAAQRRAPAAVRDGAAGDDDAHGLAAAHQLLDRLAHLGALVLVRHLVETVQQQEDVPPVLEQLHEEVGGKIEVGLLADQVVRDEVGQRPLLRRCSRRQVAAVTREGREGHEDRQRQPAGAVFRPRRELAGSGSPVEQ